MSPIQDEVLAANEGYARTFGEKGTLAMPPARQFAVLTCMDARLDPARFAGLREGDAHVIRNAGGRVTDDAIRSLVISHKLDEFYFVIDTAQPKECAVCMAYYPTPPRSLNIKVVEK